MPVRIASFGALEAWTSLAYRTDLRRFFGTDCLVIGDDGVQLTMVRAHRRASIARARWTRLLLLIGALQQSAKLRHPHLIKQVWGGRRLQPGLRFEHGE